MKSICLLILFFVNPCFAQQSRGIVFEKETNWEAIKQKAKKENKYIFLDTYTTWCMPCQFMAKNIFPQELVGDFFNKHFINVAIQMDTTKHDDVFVRNWYRDAKRISDMYKIGAYPTYLFFNPNRICLF